jgi:hypothetical protein
VKENRHLAVESSVSAETKRGRMRIKCQNGHVFGAWILLSLNTEMDPEELEVLSLSGLQTVRCPVCRVSCAVAEPVIIHDFVGERVALFVPDVLSHRELHFRAELLHQLADTEKNWLPAYFSEFETLMGLRNLREWQSRATGAARQVSDSGNPPPVSSLSSQSKENAKEVSQSQEKDGLAIHAAFADLAGRDSTMPIPSQPGGGVDERLPVEPPQDEDWLDGATLDRSQTTRKIEFDFNSQKQAVAEAPTEETEPGPKSDESDEKKGSSPQEVDFVELLSGDEDEDDLILDGEFESDEKEIDILSDFTEISDDDIKEEASFFLPSVEEKSPGVRSQANSIGIEDGQVWISARLPTKRMARFDSSNAELKCQLKIVKGFPLVILALIDDQRKPMDHLEWFIDITSQYQLDAAEYLSRRFRVAVQLQADDSSEKNNFVVSSEREQNMQKILDRAAKAVVESKDKTSTFSMAVNAFEGLSDPLDAARLPRGDLTGPPDGLFEEIRRELDLMASWLRKERYDYLVYCCSFPLAQLDRQIVWLLQSAVKVGLHIPDELKGRAVDAGLAQDFKELVLNLVRAFENHSNANKTLSEEVRARNFRELFDDCERLGISPDYNIWYRVVPLLKKYDLSTTGFGYEDD